MIFQQVQLFIRILVTCLADRSNSCSQYLGYFLCGAVCLSWPLLILRVGGWCVLVFCFKLGCAICFSLSTGPRECPRTGTGTPSWQEGGQALQRDSYGNKISSSSHYVFD